MKIILITVLMFFGSENINAQKPKAMNTTEQNKQEITRVLEELYLQGIYKGDTVLLHEAFHPDALLFGDINGTPYAKTARAYIEGVGSRVSPEKSGGPFEPKILSIDVINSIAVAKLNLKMYTFNYYNFITLHQIAGKWVIINKTLTDVQQ